MTQEYNKVYETLVKDEYDLEGLIAYGLYKQEKRKQIIDIKTKQTRNPNQKEYDLIESLLTKHLDFYREKANQTLNGTIEYFIETQKSVLHEKYFKSYEYTLLDNKIDTIYENTNNENLESKLNTAIINTKPKSLLSELKIEVLGNLAWVIILIIISTIVYFNSGDIRRLKEKVIETLQEPKDTTISH